MMNRLRRNSVRSRLYSDTDATFLDSTNLPKFNTAQLEGRIVKTLTFTETITIGILFLAFALFVVWKAITIQVFQHEAYAKLSDANRLESAPLFALRGTIADRFGNALAWNEQSDSSIPKRVHYDSQALSHILGFVRYPQKDTSGKWWRTEIEAKTGLEEALDKNLQGVNGQLIHEVDSRGDSVTVGSVVPAENGATVTTSIDPLLTEQLYEAIKHGVINSKFRGGSGVIMDVTNGEVIAMTSYPSFDSNALTERDQKKIKEYLEDTRSPLVNRAFQGSYLPGSIIKPFVALAALEEGVISPEKGIVSTGKLVIPNPYYPDKPSIFRDWKAHGWVNMVDAIAVSSDVYFYQVGGGFEDQRGLGIAKIDAWMQKFGFGSQTGILFDSESTGNIPTPAWKAENFPDDQAWSVGNTYHSSIGQFGWLMTPLQAVRATSALANGGTLFTPIVIRGGHADSQRIEFTPENRDVIVRGMKESTRRGTARALAIAGISIAGKTGTAEVGAHKEKMHSWVIGFWPADKPRFAFAVLLENGKAGTLVGAAPTMQPFFQHLVTTRSPYVKGEYPENLPLPGKEPELPVDVVEVPDEVQE
jgi:penicillin-binding protein 2